MTVRQRSYKRILSGVCAAILIGLTGCSQKTSDEHLQAAQAFMEQDKTQAAIVELKNAIQLDPQSAAARFTLGKIYTETGDFSGAEKELQRALDLGHPASQVVPLLSQAYQRTGAHNALTDVDHTMAALTVPEQLQIGFYKLQAFIELQQLDEARLLLDELSGLESRSVYRGLVDVIDAGLEEDIERAAALAQEMRDLAPLNQDALLMLARLRLQQEQTDAAVDAYADYLSKYPNDTNTKFMLSAMLVELGRTEEADQYVDQLLELSKDNPMLNQLKGIILSEQGNFEAAYEYLDKAIDAGRNDPILRLVAGYTAFQQGDYENANLHLSLIASLLPDDHPGLKLLSASQLQLGLSDDATATLQRLQTQNSADATLFSRAGFELLKEGNVEDAKAMLARTQQLSEDTDDLLRTGVLQLSMNQIEGIINLEQAVEQSPESTTAQSTLATAYLATNQLDKAVELANDWKNAAPDSVEPLLLSAEIALRNQDVAAARADFLKARQMAPNNALALLAEGRFLAQQGDIEQALENIQNVLTDSPNNQSALALLYIVQRENGDASAALEQAEAQLEASPDDAGLRTVVARMLATEERLDDALTILDQIKVDRKAPRDYWSLKGQALIQQNQFDNADDHYEQWLSLFPYDKNAALGRLLLLDLSGGNTEAIDITNTFLSKRDDQQIRLLQAHFHSLNGDVESSRQSLSQLPQEASELPFFKGVIARNLLIEGQFSDAIEPANTAYQAAPNLRNLVTALRAVEGAGDSEAGFELLSQHAETNPDDMRARMLLAERKIQRDSSAAIQEYAALVTANPNNFVALNNLAYLLLQDGDVENAQTYAEQAVELQPRNAAAADTLAQVYRAQDKLEEALSLYERTLDDSVRSEEIFLNYIEVMLASGNNRLAERRLNERTFAEPASLERLAELAEQYGIQIPN